MLSLSGPLRFKINIFIQHVTSKIPRLYQINAVLLNVLFIKTATELTSSRPRKVLRTSLK
uniref:Uncharacterized protein n=1 Tax=Sinocyclocheilus grahami TaxID=75366 RepID=A0A672N3G1_SINGR